MHAVLLHDALATTEAKFTKAKGLLKAGLCLSVSVSVSCLCLCLWVFVCSSIGALCFISVPSNVAGETMGAHYLPKQIHAPAMCTQRSVPSKHRGNILLARKQCQEICILLSSDMCDTC